jgi:NAD(P)H-hydrate epimerase
MERAATACVNWMVEKFSAETDYTIICGVGNNGGDGLAIARLLIEKKINVQVAVIHYSENYSVDFKNNLARLEKIGIPIKNIVQVSDVLSLLFINRKKEVLIDAMIGSGLNKPITGLLAECINYINNLSLTVVSVDIPSGLFADKLTAASDSIIRATYTLTFQFPKLTFMFLENAPFVGVFTILDIGLHPEFISKINTKNHFITKAAVQLFLKKRNKASHKGNFGHALILAGGYGKMGAAILTSKACMKSGAGLLTAHIPKCGYEIMQTAFPEAMVEVDSEEEFISDAIKVEKYDVLAIGPGIGTEQQTQKVVKSVIQNSANPIVFDADAINILSENKTWLSFIPPQSIFTPHLKEFERLVGKSANSEERLILQRDFSFKYNVYVVLKGAHTSISTPNGDVFFNSTGNPGMATAGSGDVLTGIITSLLAQGYTSEQACVLGVYLHGLAGDFASHAKSEESMIASDIIDEIGVAYSFLKE